MTIMKKDRLFWVRHAGILMAERYPEIRFRIQQIREEAFTDIDFVFAHIRVGLYGMREKDEKIPLKYYVVGQETC